LAQQAALIGTFEWNIQTGVNTWTPELEAMYGLLPGGFGGTHAAFESLVYEDDRAGLRALVESTLKTGQPTKGEWRVVWPDGSVHWLAAYWQVLMDESGQPSEVIGVNMDITERKLAEKTLRDSEERFRLAAQAGKMYAYEWDVATDIIVRSGDIGRVLASTDEASLTRQQLLARVHPDDRVLFNACVRERTPENPDVQISYRLLRPDGSVVWLEKTAHAFFDEHSRMVRMIGMVADITERRRAEEALREYERAVELSEEAMAVVDRDYRFLIANRKYLRLRKMTKEQVVGHFVPEVLNKGVFEGVVKEKLDECFQGKVVRYEMKYTYPELGEREVLVSYFPIKGANGVDRVASIMQDITDSKRLERVLADMSRKLIEAQEQERARIARELHDDIGQRLAMMSVELERLRDIPSEAQSRAQELRKELSQISEDVQALSHELHDSKLEYLGAIAAIRSWCKEFAERQRIDIDFKSSVRSVLPVELGRTLLRVLQEALHNAVKHSGVKRVEVRLIEESNQVHLIVSDSGKGFDIESAMQGKGLGLASMRERVKLVNGTIAIQSKPMGGTTIEVRVPLEAQHGSQRAS
jgi:PAS domain S-box-containing protein